MDRDARGDGRRAGHRQPGLRGSEGTFSLCTFAYVDALARAGRVDDSRQAFEKMLTYANHVGLFSEEIALNGEQIGNFPQAFTHLALIDAAITLDAALNAGLTSGHGASPISAVPRSTTIERGPAATRSPACRLPWAVTADGSNVSISATHC